MSYERRDFAGSAVSSKLSTDITAGATSFTITNAAGWPSGTNGKFLVTIGRNTASEEKVFVQSRSGTTLTLASASDRGAEGTSAQAHGAGADIDHVSGSTDADEANYAVNQTVGKVTTKGDLIVATGANTFARQAVGANNTVPIADSAQSNGIRYGQLDGASLAAGVAGSGLGGANGSALSVNVDNSTVEISSDSVRVKDGGVTGAKLNANVVDNSTIALAANQLQVKDLGITYAKTATVPAVRATRTTNQSIPDTTFTKVIYNATDDWDTHTYHDTVTNNTRVTIPTGLGGRYRFTTNVVFEANATGNRQVRLILNNTSTYALMTTAAQASHAWVSTTSYELALVPTDFVEVQVWQNTGGALNLAASTFSAKWESP